MKQATEPLTYTVAHFDVEASSVAPVWKAASKKVNQFAMSTTCLLIRDDREGAALGDDIVSEGELIATDGRLLARFALPCPVAVPAAVSAVHGAGRTRAILLDSKALALAMKGKGRAVFTVTMREGDARYNVTVRRWEAGGETTHVVPAVEYVSGGQYHGSDFPQVDVVTPGPDRREANVYLNRDYLRTLLDSATLKGETIRIGIPLKADGSVEPAPVTVDTQLTVGDGRHSRSVIMPVVRN